MSQYFTPPFDPSLTPNIEDLTTVQLKALLEQLYPTADGGLFWPSASPPDTGDTPRQRFLWGEIVTDGFGNKTLMLRWYNPDTATWDAAQFLTVLADGSVAPIKLDASGGLLNQVLGKNSLGEVGWLTVNDIVTALAINKITNGGVTSRILGTTPAGVNAWLTPAEVAALVGPLVASPLTDKGILYNHLHWTALPYGTASGTDTYSVTILPNTASTHGDGTRTLVLWIKFTNANTGAATLAFNGLSAKAIVKNGSEALVAGDIKAGSVHMLMYDGTQFQVVLPPRQANALIYRKQVAATAYQAYTSPNITEIEIDTESDGEGIVTLAGTGRFTLIPGTYEISVNVPYQNTGSAGVAQLRFEQVGGSVQFARGRPIDPDFVELTMVVPQFTIAVSTEYKITITSNQNGRIASPVNLGGYDEIGTQVQIRKLK